MISGFRDAARAVHRPAHMSESLILALDIGVTAVRAALFDITTRRFASTATLQQIPLHTSPDGGAEIEAGALLAAARHCITGTLHLRHRDEALRGRSVKAVAVSCFWHGMVGCTEKGEAVTRIITPADSRSREASAVVRGRFDERKMHARTGCMLRNGFWLAKMTWLQRDEGRLFERARQWMSPGEWLQLRLTGEANCSLSMASGTGLLDLTAKKWDATLLKSAGLSPEKLRPLSDAPTPIGGQFAQEIPELRGLPWFPAIGDGAALTLGCGATHPGAAMIAIGDGASVRVLRDGAAAAPFGLSCHLVDERRHVAGAAIANSGNLRAWCMRELRISEGPELDAALAARTAPRHGLVALPFWNTDGAPAWCEDTPGVLLGLRQSTTAHDILQALTEATCHRLARIVDMLCEEGAAPKFILAAGQSRTPADVEHLAGILGRPLHRGDPEGTAERGAAVFALEKSGYPIPPQKLVNPVKPRKAAAKEYAAERERQRRIEELLAG